MLLMVKLKSENGWQNKTILYLLDESTRISWNCRMCEHEWIKSKTMAQLGKNRGKVLDGNAGMAQLIVRLNAVIMNNNNSFFGALSFHL